MISSVHDNSVNLVKDITIIAITGRSGSGKSTVANYYKSKGFFVIDADKAAKKVNEKGSACLKELADAFGEDILTDDGELNKKMLAERAFSSKQLTKSLTEITHPYIVKLLLSKIETAKNNKNKIAFVDGAVIIGGMFEKYCDEIILVTSPEEDAIKRIIRRDNITKESALKRLNAQLNNDVMKKKCQYIINNNSTHQELIEKSDEILEKITLIGV